VSSHHLARRARLVVGLTAGVLVVAACGSDGSAEPVRSYTLHLRAEDSEPEYVYIAEDPVDLRVGDEVTFEFDNTGSLAHDLQVVDPAGDAIGVSPVAAPGATTSVTVLFEEPGLYRLNCLVDNHLTEHGMQAIVEVTDA
jgi:plastocyanin